MVVVRLDLGTLVPFPVPGTCSVSGCVRISGNVQQTGAYICSGRLLLFHSNRKNVLETDVVVL